MLIERRGLRRLACLAAATFAIQMLLSRDARTASFTPLRGEVRATHGIVAAGRSFAADAGARILASGGNAIDAGVAAIYAAAVVEISHFGLGGEAPIILYSARGGEVAVINGQGPAPKAATPALFAGRDAIPGNGPLGATIPAMIDSTAIALSRYGTRSLGDVLTPAIALADGFPMYEFLRRYLQSERRACEPYPWTMRTYYPDGKVTPTGEMFRQPNLARTLRALAEAEQTALRSGATREQAIRAGRDPFYKGDIARRIVAANREAGGIFSEEDLASYEGRVEKPYTVRYRGHDVFKAGPWNQSPVLLQTLRLLEGFDLAAMGPQSADALHTIAEAIKLAYADRDRYYGDPDFVKVPMDALLSDAYAAARRRLIDPRRASIEHRPGDPLSADPARISPDAWLPFEPPARTARAAPEPGDTTSVQVADAAGNLFSATPSSGWLLIIDFKFGVQAAIEAPRINSLHPESSFDDHRSQPGVLEVERTVGAAVLDELRRRGHVIQVRGPYGMSTGVVAAGWDPATGRLRGGADPRRERYIVAW